MTITYGYSQRTTLAIEEGPNCDNDYDDGGYNDGAWWIRL
jgi:hypothetical protein